jgi:hypothetical protein
MGLIELDANAIIGEVIEVPTHVHCLRCDVMLPEFSRFCLLCGAAQFDPPQVAAPSPPPLEPQAAAPAPSAPQQAPEILFVEPAPQAPLDVPSPWEKIKSMQKLADAKLSLMESDRYWARNILRK